MRELFKDIQNNINADNTFLELEPFKSVEFETLRPDSIVSEEHLNKVADVINKEIFKRILLILIENLKPEEIIEVMKNNNIKNFICSKDSKSDMEFNHDYYDKWKLKNKIDNF